MDRKSFNKLKDQSPSPLYAHRDFVCGLGAAFFETLFTFPLNKLIFRQQLHNIKANQAAGQLFSEGFRFLYRGLLPPLCQKAASRAIMFGMYDRFSAIAGCSNDRSFSFCRSCAAFLSGCTESLLTPFERVQTLMQCRRYHGRFRNTIHVFHDIASYGIREYYRGWTVILLRNGPSNVLFFGCRQPLHEITMDLVKVENSAVKELACHFVVGAVLGATLSTLFFPMNVVKTYLQSQLGGAFESPLSAFKTVMRDRNYQIGELFRGVHLNYTRSLLTWGITNTVYELLKWTLFGDRG